MLAHLVKKLEQEIINLHVIRKELSYHALMEGQFLDLQQVDTSLISLRNAINNIQGSQLFKQEYEEMYGNPEEEDHNPYVKVFKGGGNPYIKRFGGKRVH